MTTISIDDEIINELVSVSHCQNAQEAIMKIINDYLQQQKIKKPLFDQLRLISDFENQEIEDLFQRNKNDTGRELEL